MLFAAGLGTRMAPLTDDRPKPLIEVAGKALIDHAADIADAAGFGIQVVNVHYKAPMMHEWAARRGLRVSDETGGLLDTGGGLRKALPLLGPDPVATMNTDAVWLGPNPLERVTQAWDALGERAEALLLLIPRDRAVSHPGEGSFLMDSEGRLTRGPGQVFTGVQILRTQRLKDCPEGAFSLNVLWDEIAAEGRLYGVSYGGSWCDVGTPAGIAAAEAMMDGAE